MKSNLKKHFYDIRRKIAKLIVPEFFWPKNINIDNVEISLRGAPYVFGVKLGLKNGSYEAPERNLIKQIDLKGEQIIELGGSIGILTAILAHKIGSSGRIISVEASNKLSDYSRIWLQKNKIISVVTGFAFPVYSLKKLINVVNFDESGSNLTGIVEFQSESSNKLIQDNNENIYDIQKLCNQYKINPTFLVIDIEGSERILVEQKPDFPSSIHLILIELHPWIYGEEIQEKIIEVIIREGFIIAAKASDSFLFKRDETLDK